jgi:hypothetical protein
LALADDEMGTFARHIGIDYSGAQTPTASLKGLRVYMADGFSPPIEVMPPASPRKYWTRRGVAEWLVERLAEDTPALVGIDHGFSFPLRYFEKYGLKPDWPTFLDDFQRHWPTDEDIYVDCVRDGAVGNGATRMGNTRWRRLTGILTNFVISGFTGKSRYSTCLAIILPKPSDETRGRQVSRRTTRPYKVAI